MKSWLDVIDALYKGAWRHDLQRFRSPYAFRGNSRLDHTLASSLVRLSRPEVDVHRLELALLRNFRKYAHEQGAAADSIWDWLALGQHRGLPTRLLDWTYSPLVALHFVTEDPVEFDEDGVVWFPDSMGSVAGWPGTTRRPAWRGHCRNGETQPSMTFGRCAAPPRRQDEPAQKSRP